jgi:hypothetical protein
MVGPWPWPWGPGGLCSPVLVLVLVLSTLRYARRDFRQNKSGPRTPRPRGGPPALGSFVRRAEGLPSTRNWPFPFRWPLGPCYPPATSPPQVIPKAMRAARWPGRWFWRMELHQRHHSRAAGAPALLQFEWLSKTRGAAQGRLVLFGAFEAYPPLGTTPGVPGEELVAGYRVFMK